jgi:L-lactate utilization protein LutC
MSARDRILERVRRATGGAAVEKPADLRPAISRTADPVAQFTAQAEGFQATVARLASAADLPGAVAGELRKRNLPAAIRTGEDALFERDWGTVERSTGPGRLAEPVTMTRAELGVAETGSLVFASGPENPVTLNFLGETHFAVVAARDIVEGYEEAWARLRGRERPRTVNWVSGPSRSADIGQTLQLGAHGPVALHIFVVDDMEG